MGWPHYLIPASFFNHNLREELLAGVALDEADVVFRVPVTASDDQVEEAGFPQVIDQVEYLQRAGYFEASSLAEVVLDVDDDQGNDK